MFQTALKVRQPNREFTEKIQPAQVSLIAQIEELPTVENWSTFNN